MTNGNINDIQIGSTGLSLDVQQKLSEFITDLDAMVEFNNGPTAAFFHVAAILAEHIKDKDV